MDADVPGGVRHRPRRLVAALWKVGAIERVGPGWTAIGNVIAVGRGLMISVANSGNKEAIEIDGKR